MNNKILLEVEVPMIEKNYEIFIPVGKSLKRTISAIQKDIYELSKGDYKINENANIYLKENGQIIPQNILIMNSSLKNGSKVVIF